MFILLSENLYMVLSLCKSVLLLSEVRPSLAPCLARACFKKLFQSRYIQSWFCHV